MAEIMTEEDMMIEEVIKSFKGKSAKQKILIAKSQLGVIIHDVVDCPPDLIRRVIKARMEEPCPVCKSEVIGAKKCSACGGKGYVTAVEAEKILLKAADIFHD